MITVNVLCLHTVLFTITLSSIHTLLFTCAFFFTMWIFFHTLLYNCPYALLHWIFTITCSTVYNYSPQYTYFAVYICFHFHNVNILHTFLYNCRYTMFTLNLLCLHAVLFTITLPSILSVLFTYAYFSQCDIFSQLLPNLLHNNVYSISSTYTYSTVYN